MLYVKNIYKNIYIIRPLSTITLTSPDGDDTVIQTKLSAGGTIAVINTDAYSAVYTLPVGGAATITPTVSGNVVSGPETRRKVQLGYI